MKKVVIATMHDSEFYWAEAEQAKADGFIIKSSLRSGLVATFGRGKFTPVPAISPVVSGK